jgi:hypothetical protein
LTTSRSFSRYHSHPERCRGSSAFAPACHWPFLQDDAAIDRLINEFGEKDPAKQSWSEMFIKRAVKNGIKWLGPQIMV